MSVVAIAGGTPHEIAGRRDAFLILERAFEHPGLLDLDVLVIGELRAGSEPEERGDEPAVLVLDQHFHVDAGMLMAADLEKLNGMGTRTMELREAKVAMMGATIMISNAHVTQADLAAKNGVIHVVDAVIMPPGR